MGLVESGGLSLPPLSPLAADPLRHSLEDEPRRRASRNAGSSGVRGPSEERASLWAGVRGSVGGRFRRGTAGCATPDRPRPLPPDGRGGRDTDDQRPLLLRDDRLGPGLRPGGLLALCLAGDLAYRHDRGHERALGTAVGGVLLCPGGTGHPRAPLRFPALA